MMSFAAGCPLLAQTLMDSVIVGSGPIAVAVNSTTNKVYVANQNSNNITVIDGATNSTITVNVGLRPVALAIHGGTNKIYVANQNSSTVTIIDGPTNSTATVNVGFGPSAIAVNPVTNKVYTANYDGTVTVIDAATRHASTVQAGRFPAAIATNPVTNKIYVANSGNNSVTVIDGATNHTSTVPVGSYPEGLAVNPITNKIYVANAGNGEANGSVTMIDGASNSTTSIDVGRSAAGIAVDTTGNRVYVTNKLDGTTAILNPDTLSSTTIPVGGFPEAVAVNPITGKIYLANYLWTATATMIDGMTESTTTIYLEQQRYPTAVALNAVTNRVYVANFGSNRVSVIAGAASNPLQFVPVTPCRVADTRRPLGPFGGPSLSGGSTRDFAIADSACGIPASARAYSLNVTVVPRGYLGYLTVWPMGEDRPTISMMNSWDGRIKANATIVPAGSGAAINVFASDATDVVLDITGYFVAAPDPSSLLFYPLPPCRVADTRKAKEPLGGPYLERGKPREFPVLAAVGCGIPSIAQAYSLNFTAVPRVGALWVFSSWPAGQAQPGTSVLNAPTGTITANAAIIPAGDDGGIDVWASDDTDLVIDINGYFAPAGAGGLSLYRTVSCRTLDTRRTTGLFTGQIAINVGGTACGLPASAGAYVLSATAVPSGPLWILSLWPDGLPQTLTSTLNALDGAVTSNLAIVPTTNGWIDAYAAGSTQLILDISTYFAP